MVEASAARDKLSPTAARSPAGNVAGAEAAAGEPVVEPPPLVEFGDPPTADPARPPTVGVDPPQPSGAGQRPPRRSFLVPVSATGAAPRAEPAMPERPTRPPDRSRPLASSRPAAAAPPGPAALAKPRRWRRRLAVGGGIAAALALAVAGQIATTGDGIDRLQAAVAGVLPGVKPPPGAADAASAPSQRVVEQIEHARAGDTEAQLALAIHYAKGDGVAQDYAAAAKWFRAAAERGLMRAQYDLGVLYERGRGVPLDYGQAAAWYRKAAEQSHPLAQYNLAVAHTKGQGVRQNFFEAAVWYHRAAAQGVVAAMVNLAILYERGEGVDGSTVDAYAWYRAAARRGSPPAARRAEDLLQAFSPLEQTRAEAKTADINASIRDAVGESSRQASRKAPAAAAAEGGPVLKSGIESGRSARRGGETRAENP